MRRMTGTLARVLNVGGQRIVMMGCELQVTNTSNHQHPTFNTQHPTPTTPSEVERKVHSHLERVAHLGKRVSGTCGCTLDSKGIILRISQVANP